MGESYYERNRERIRAQQRAYYERNRDQILDRVKARKLTPEQRMRKNQRERERYRAGGEDARAEARRKRSERTRADPTISGRDEQRRDPLKKEAKRLVRNAIRRGDLTRQPCEACGRTPAQAHHDDYSKPLDVRWLCSTHHGMQHRKGSYGSSN